MVKAAEKLILKDMIEVIKETPKTKSSQKVTRKAIQKETNSIKDIKEGEVTHVSKKKRKEQKLIKEMKEKLQTAK